MPKALITGISGFTGRYLAQDLAARGYEVIGLSSPSETRGEDEALQIRHCDLLDRTGLASAIEEIQPDVVAHLAAISFVAHGDAEAIYKVNIVGTRNLLEALAASSKRPSSVLVASSANIYGNSPVEVIDETVPPAPANDYAVSKLAMEYMARLWMGKLPIFITRPFNYTGVGQASQFLLPKIVGHFQRGDKKIELGNIDVERDFSDVRFVSQAYCDLLEKAPAGEIFNICSGTAYALKDVLGMMAEIAGYEIEVTVNPLFVRANEVKRLQGSPRKLLETIGNQRIIPLRETLAAMWSSEVQGDGR